MLSVEQNIRPSYDIIIHDIADYVMDDTRTGALALETARYCLMDTLGCGILALQFPECTKLLGPIVPGAVLAKGARVPGTGFALDPVQAAFNIGVMNRWLDYNDTWLAAEWGHPSDNLAAILAIADYLGRNGMHNFTMQDVLAALIKAYEIQGCLALKNSFNRVGLDHVFLVKLASAAIAAKMLGGDHDMVMRTISQVLVDGQSLRVYRHAPNTGSRKSWAAGDAAARGVRLALLSQAGEAGYPSALSVPKWGFYDASFGGNPWVMERGFGSYVMENILFKICWPAEFHAQTAVECAVALHPQVAARLDEIKAINITTHESALRIICKEGKLYNPADRDHCLQYMVAVALINGDLTAQDYEDDMAANPLIDDLRARMLVSENRDFSRDYLDPDKRSIANSIEIIFNDNSKTETVTVEYPVGHKRRRIEGVPLLMKKFSDNISTLYDADFTANLLALFQTPDELYTMKVTDFMELWRAPCAAC